MKYDEFEYSIGNLKIGKDTLIVNMGSASNCPSKKAGLCNVNCYAVKAEIIYPNTMPYRNRQEAYWLSHNELEIAEAIYNVVNKKNSNPKTKVKLKYIRFNESGDFHSKECLTKLIKIAKILPDLVFYTYTHRSDIVNSQTYKRLPKNLVINTSNFQRKGLNSFNIDTNVRAHGMKDFTNHTKELKKNFDFACMGNCFICGYCKKTHGKKIGVPLH